EELAVPGDRVHHIATAGNHLTEAVPAAAGGTTDLPRLRLSRSQIEPRAVVPVPGHAAVRADAVQESGHDRRSQGEGPDERLTQRAGILQARELVRQRPH